MDAELLKCKRTHDIMSIYLPKARKLLYKLSYVNQIYPDHPAVAGYKARLAATLRPHIMQENISANIASYALYITHCALYYLCTTTPRDKRVLFVELRKLVDRWVRIVLCLDASDPKTLLLDFCALSSHINFHPSSLDDMIGFVCPLCILNDVFSDIGWTNYVCPQNPSSMSLSNTVSKRGVEEQLPEGLCEHVVSIKTTVYNRLFEETSCS